MISGNLKLNTSPDLALNNITDVLRGTPEDFTKSNKGKFASLVKLSNLKNLWTGEFRFWVPLTKGTTVFRNHIARVLSASANRKVSGVTATFNITRMENDQPIRNFTFGNLVSESMGVVNNAIVNESAIAILTNGAVTSPEPTSVSTTRAVNFRPENIIDIFVSSFSSFNGKSTTFWAAMLGCVIVLLNKFFLTVGADSGTIEAHGNLSFPCHSLGCYEQREGFLWLKSDYIIPQLRLN